MAKFIKYSVEVHVKADAADFADVFCHQFSEEATARRCYDRAVLALSESLYEVRLWYGVVLLAKTEVGEVVT